MAEEHILYINSQVDVTVRLPLVYFQFYTPLFNNRCILSIDNLEKILKYAKEKESAAHAEQVQNIRTAGT